MRRLELALRPIVALASFNPNSAARTVQMPKSKMEHLVAVLADAIKSRRQIRFRARGHHREVCPHVLHTRDERIWSVLVWQCGGTCELGLPSGGDWRLFDLAEISELESLEGGWWYPPARSGAYDRAATADKLVG